MSLRLAACAVAALLVHPAEAASPRPEPEPEPIPVVPMDDGTGVREVLRLEPFRLSAPLAYDHRAEQPRISEGYVIVLRVQPALAQARSVQSPVLYVGDTPVQILARDPASGCLSGVLPRLDLAAEPVGFGSWQLPERVDAARGAAERTALLAAGVRPRPVAELARVTLSQVLGPMEPDALLRHAAAAIAACK